MTRRPLLAGLMAALVLLAPLALAQAQAPPEGVATAEHERVRFAHWVGDAALPNATFAPDENATLWLAVAPLPAPADDPGANGTENGTANDTASLVALVELSSTSLQFAQPNLTLAVPAEEGAWAIDNVSFSAAEGVTGAASFTFTVTVRESNETGTVLETFTGGGSVTVLDVELPVPPVDTPFPYLTVGIVAAVLLAGGAGALVYRQRQERARRERAPRRSQALREQQLEQRMQRAQEKERVEEVQQIQQEIRQQERVREVRREVQILEAKRADALKTLDLLRKRHEAGGLTKLQYETMAAKKQADLERIEREIAQMQADDDRGAAA